MTRERIEEIFEDYQKALERLKEALAMDLSEGNIVVDGTIQRFEFTFELAWKLAKNVLSYKGIEADTPRDVIKEAFKAKLITNGGEWIDMLVDRNKTSHIYDEKEAVKIYEKVKTIHYPSLKIFCDNVLKLADIA